MEITNIIKCGFALLEIDKTSKWTRAFVKLVGVNQNNAHLQFYNNSTDLKEFERYK